MIKSAQILIPVEIENLDILLEANYQQIERLCQKMRGINSIYQPYG
jgi:hypothetical protein